MVDPTQILLFTVVTVLTALLVAVGIQVFFVLREVKRSVEKINKILEEASVVASSVSKPVIGIANFVEGIKGLRDLIDMVSQRHGKQLSEGYEEEHLEEPEGHSHIEALQERGRRFFHKDGKPLTS